MSIVSIISNFAADISRINLQSHSTKAQNSIAKLSSGERVFEAKEDPAALALGSSLAVEVASLRSAQLNVNQGVATLQVADGALGEISNILNRMKSLASQSLSSQVTNTERAYLNQEYQELASELDRISSSTEFNGVLLLGGRNEFQVSALGTNIDTDNGFVAFEFGNNVSNGDVFEVSYYAPTKMMTVLNTGTGVVQSLAVDSPDVGFLQTYNFEKAGLKLTFNSDFDDTTSFAHLGADEELTANQLVTPSALLAEYQVGIGTSTDDRITVNLPVVNMQTLGLGGTTLVTRNDSQLVMGSLDAAIDAVSSARATVGASMSRLETAGLNIGTTIDNSESARSALLDVDVAAEITQLTSQQMLEQAAINMLSKANQRPETLLRLLGN